MKNKRVLVVLGGTSGEREVSLDSGRACIKALKKIGYKVSTFDPKKKSCVQVCMGCKYEDNMKSQEFNEYDPCFPNGVYDGREKDGTIKCNCGIDNKYCSDSFIGNIFSTIGLILR